MATARCIEKKVLRMEMFPSDVGIVRERRRGNSSTPQHGSRLNKGVTSLGPERKDWELRCQQWFTADSAKESSTRRDEGPGDGILRTEVEYASPCLYIE